MRIAVALTFSLTGLLFAQEPNRPNPPSPPQPPQPAPATEKPQEPQAPKTISLGQRLPEATALKDIDGKEHKAADYKGKLVVLNFFSIQCPIQAAWDPTLAALQREYEAKGVVFLNIDSNTTEIDKPVPEGEGAKPYAAIRAHLAKKELPYTVLVDHGNKVADLLQASATPHVFVFAKDGRLVYRGLIDDDQRRSKGDAAKRYLADTLDQLLAGAKVEPSETQPVGCSIKRARSDGDGPGRGQRQRGRQRSGGDGGR